VVDGAISASYGIPENGLAIERALLFAINVDQSSGLSAPYMPFFIGRQCLSALPCRLKGTPLISSASKNVEDICAVAGLAVADKVLSGGEALHTGADACRFTRIWMLPEQPETLGDPVN
jgi:hypothetical protein